MYENLKILILEDLPTDAELAQRELRTVLNGHDTKVVDTEIDFVNALKNFKPDLIISDYQLPTFDGLSALRITREKSPFTPFIILTGSMNEDTAVECMKAGADDYVIKEHIKRLGSVVLNTLEKKQIEKEHHLALQALRESEEQYRTLFNRVPVGLYRSTPEGKILDANQTMLHMLGYKDLNSLLKTNVKTHYKNVKDRERWKSIMEKDGVAIDFEVEFLRMDGKVIWIKESSRVVKDNHQKEIFYEGALEDITERKNAEKAHELLSAAIEQAVEAVVITDAKGDIQYVNPAFEKNSGFSREEVIGKNPRILKSGEHDNEFYKELWETISSGKVWKGQITNKQKRGTFIIEEITISPVFDSFGKISNYVAVNRDITREQELEAQFQQSQKMESIGRLAGGVAHDFNNMLSVILGYSELALTKLKPEDPLHGEMLEINKAGQRSASLTTQLLAFARKQTITPKVLDLNDTISNMLKMLRRLIGEDIELIWKPGPKIGKICLDPAQIDQILANLCVNARDAINGVGKIIIETKNEVLSEEFCRLNNYANPGSYITLTINDTGCGMDSITLSQIYEPFFTTKKQGEGTGLGLSTVYGIVKQNDGIINVESEPNHGTSFKIYFPRYTEADQVGFDEEKVHIPLGNGENILLVEDEQAILEVTQVMLRKAGYKVTIANNPEEALLVSVNKSECFDLLITDVVMPDMNGRELANRIQKNCPDMKVLYMSGYSANIIAHKGVLDEGVNFITKPFSYTTLAQKIYEVLKK